MERPPWIQWFTCQRSLIVIAGPYIHLAPQHNNYNSLVLHSCAIETSRVTWRSPSPDAFTWLSIQRTSQEEARRRRPAPAEGLHQRDGHLPSLTKSFWGSGEKGRCGPFASAVVPCPAQSHVPASGPTGRSLQRKLGSSFLVYTNFLQTRLLHSLFVSVHALQFWLRKSLVLTLCKAQGDRCSEETPASIYGKGHPVWAPRRVDSIFLIPGSGIQNKGSSSLISGHMIGLVLLPVKHPPHWITVLLVCTPHVPSIQAVGLITLSNALWGFF